MENIKKEFFSFKWKQWVNTGLLITITIMVWNASIDLKTKTFPDVESMVKTMLLVDNLTTEQITDIIKHVDTDDIHQTMNVKDSIFVREDEQVIFQGKIMDDINELNAKLWVQGQMVKENNRMLKKLTN